MAVVWRTRSNATGDSNGSGNQTLPTGTVAGDLLIVQHGFEKGSEIVITDNGWTPVEREDQGTNGGQYIGRRIASAGDISAGNVARPSFSTTAKWSCSISRFDGHDATTPMDVAATGANSASGNPNPPSIDPVTSDCLICAFVSAKTQTTYTAMANYTERYDDPNSASGQPSLAMFDRQIVGHAAEDPGSPTPASASEWVAATIAIRPGGAVTAKGPLIEGKLTDSALVGGRLVA